MSDDIKLDRILDQLCNEYEANWLQSKRPSFQDFLDKVDPQYHQKLLGMLVEVDVSLCLDDGKTVLAEDYAELGDSIVKHVRALINDRDKTIPPQNSTNKLVHEGSSPPAPPKQIGPYKLLQQIGEGGMGSVWMAEQEKPVRRRVALKLIRADMGSKEVVARFEAERQALAMMNHQNIAKILDAGTSEQGNPYFVMELVKGVPITEYCDEHKLGVRERVKLFIPVCKAIQHAHQKGIIHRDLKPSNVLVTLYDGEAVPKVIDFGLAKALEHTTKLTDKTMFTEFGKVVGTIQYMSPEQAEMNALDVDARTDTYSLGVMLYELLTGSTPLDKKSIGKHAILQVLQMIREIEPPKPSHRLSTAKEKITTISQQRSINPTKLSAILKGELDWVVMKALEKDRTRRYESAGHFANDLQRYIDDEPVQARPPSQLYLLKKLVAKHFWLVAAMVVFIVLASIAVIGTSYGMYSAYLAQGQAEQEKDRADDLRKDADESAKQAKQLAISADLEKQKAVDALVTANQNLAVNHWRDNDVGKALEALCSIPPDKRNFEWHFAWRQIQGSDLTVYAHSSPFGATGVVFGNNGNHIYSNGHDGYIKAWDARTGKFLKTLVEDRSVDFHNLRISPDQTVLAAICNYTQILIWDINNENRLHLFDANAVLQENQLEFSPDGKKIASIDINGALNVWEIATGKKIFPPFVGNSSENPGIVGGKKTFIDFAWVPSSDRIVTAWHVYFPGVKNYENEGDDRNEYWLEFIGTADWQVSETLKNLPPIQSLDMFADGKRVSINAGSSISVCNLVNGERQNSFTLGKPGIKLEISPNENLIACLVNEKKIIEVRRVADGTLVSALKGHSDAIVDFSFSPNSRRLVSIDEGGELKVWHIGSQGPESRYQENIIRPQQLMKKELLRTWHYKPGENRLLQIATISEPGLRTTLQLDQFIEDLDKIERGPSQQEPSPAIGGFRQSPQGSLVMADVANHTAIWDADSGRLVVTDKGMFNGIGAFHNHDQIVFGPNDRMLVTTDHDNQIKIIDSRDGKIISSPQFDFAIDRVRLARFKFAFSNDGHLLAASSPNSPVQVFETASGKKVATLPVFNDSVAPALQFTDDRKHLVVLSYGQLEKWRINDGKFLKAFGGPVSENFQLIENGTRILAVSYANRLSVIDTESMTEIRSIPMDKLQWITWCQDKQHLVTCHGQLGFRGYRSPEIFKIWPLQTNGSELRIEKIDDAAMGVFSPTDNRIATLNTNRTVSIIEGTETNELTQLQAAAFNIDFAFSNDGKVLLIDSYIRKHLSNTEELTRIAFDLDSGNRIDEIPEKYDTIIRHFTVDQAGRRILRKLGNSLFLIEIQNQ